jgi:hypothetical protein
MPHVDDGTLHALLDGALRAEDPARADSVEAHLDSCPDCRTLRDQAAALRAGATGILAALEPDARPDFQEVLARAGHGVAAAAAGVRAGAGSPEASPALAGGGAGHLRGQARATRAMAWAATVVLALGTGYLIRDLVEPDAGFVAVQERSAADAVHVEPSTPPTPPAAPTPAAAAEVVPPAVAPTAGAPPGAVRAAPAPTAAAPPTVARAEAEVLAAAEPDVALEEIMVAAPAMAREPVLTRPAPGRQDAPAVVARQMVEDAADRPAIRLRGATAVTAGTAGTDWSAITDADALALMDGPLYVLPGAVVDSIFARGQGHTAEVRSLQRLDGVVLLTVTQRRADGPDAAVYAEALAPQTEPAVGSARHERHWITVTGELPAETLRALAASASPLRDHGPAGPPR